ncbi:MAG: PAS domain S-box protein, partial [Perlabentimonas sp.]
MTNKPKSSQGLKEELDLLKRENQMLRRQLEEAKYSNSNDIDTNSGIHEYQNFFNLSIDLLCIADTKGNFIKVNKAWEKILGYPIEELEGRKFLDFVHPDDIQSTLDAMKRLDEQMEVHSFVNRYKGRNGQWYYIEWRSFPLGEKIYAAARDITDMKQLEIQLKKKNEELVKSQKRIEESERNYRKIYNSATDAIFVHHPQSGKIIDVNESMLKMYGYRSRKEVLGMDISCFSSIDDGYSPDKAKELISKALSSRNTTFEWCASKKSGEKFWVEVSLRNTIIEGEKRVVASARDITDRKKTEERI